MLGDAIVVAPEAPPSTELYASLRQLSTAFRCASALRRQFVRAELVVPWLTAPGSTPRRGGGSTGAAATATTIADVVAEHQVEHRTRVGSTRHSALTRRCHQLIDDRGWWCGDKRRQSKQHVETADERRHRTAMRSHRTVHGGRGGGAGGRRTAARASGPRSRGARGQSSEVDVEGGGSRGRVFTFSPRVEHTGSCGIDNGRSTQMN